MKRRTPPSKRFFDGHYEGQVDLEPDTLRLAFDFLPLRTSLVKHIRGARFNKIEKELAYPVEGYSELRSSALFGDDRVLYCTPPELLAATSEERAAAIQAAKARITQDPFSVPEATIQTAYPDLVLRLSTRGSPSLRASVRYNSAVVKIIEALPQCFFIASEHAYFIPVHLLNEILRTVRAQRLSFCVEEHCGSALKETAAERSTLLKSPASPSASPLERCILTPYLEQSVESGEPRFALCHATAPHLRVLFPQLAQYAERRQHSQNLTPRDLLDLLHAAQAAQVTLYHTSRVAEFLAEHRQVLEERLRTHTQTFNEAMLAVMQPDLSWIVDGKDRAGLLVNRELLQSKFISHARNPLYKIKGAELASYPQHLLFVPAPTRLPELHGSIAGFIASIEIPAPLESPAFKKALSRAQRRIELLQRTKHFQSLKDAALEAAELSAPEVGQKLFPHQRVAVQWLAQTPQALLGDDMGLGKTLSVLTYFDLMRTRGECDFLVVACPNSLTRNWLREVQNWFPSRRLARLPDTKSDKKYFLFRLSEGNIELDGLVLNYEALRLDYVHPEIAKLARARKVLLCLDESQRVKNPASKIFEVLSGIAPLCNRRVLLSGTPIPKDISDIWAQVLLLDQGERFGTHYYHWLEKIAELGNEYSEVAVKRFRPKEVQEVISRVHELLLRRKKEDVVSLPPKLFSTRDLELSGEQLKRYDEIREELLLRMTTLNGRTFIREINNVLEQYLRAVQVASNPRLIDEAWKGDPIKFLELDDIVTEIAGEREQKLVIWTNYLGNIRELTARYRVFGALPFSGEVSTADRDESVRRFQTDPAVRVLVAVPAAGGVGITLTAAQTVVYVDKTWNAEHWLQSIDRVHRIGQCGTVNVISLSACGVDELIARNLARKARTQSQLLGDERELFSGNAAPSVSEIESEYPSREELLQALGKK